MKNRGYSSRFRVILWTRRARSLVLNKIEQLLPASNQPCMPAIQSILDELAKNALKANYKFLLIRRRMRLFLEEQGRVHELDEICEDTARYNDFLSKHPQLAANLTDELRRLLDQEGIWIKMRNQYPEAGREYSAEDEKKIQKTEDYRAIYEEVKDNRIYLEIRLTLRNQFLWVEVINKAPILHSDLNRIYERRQEFHKYQQEGREMEFFIGNMDTSDGGSGFGYATIDTQLTEMGQNPTSALAILPLHSTNILLTLNLETLNCGAAA